MCGITGYRFMGDTPAAATGWLNDSVASLKHRGPDDRGTWEQPGIGLGHTRLSILDLSPLGHQPMVSADGAWIMIFNGEIYNFREIRSSLEAIGHRFLGTGDSEVILAAFSQWGPTAVQRFIGMFAIALWHQPTRRLHLLRDRLGVKPIYYAWDGSTLLFGSELKALRAYRQAQFSVDPAGLADYFHYGYIGESRTIYRNVYKLPPAHRLELAADGTLTTQRYWSALDAIGQRAQRTEDELADELEALMVDAFKYRMIADVPVGVFLSGGIDSSIVAAILQKHGGQRINTYTIGFDVPAYDESSHARAVAEHLGTDHHSRTLSVDEAKRLLPKWGDLYDEPFADASGIPTLLVSRVAAEHVKVVLSADGGDELFAGYSAYGTALQRLRWVRGIPQPVMNGASGLISAMGVPHLEAWLGERKWPDSVKRALPSGLLAKARKLSERSGSRTIGEVFNDGLSYFSSTELSRLVGHGNNERRLADVFPGSPGEQICLWDLHHYMPDDILTKVDRATMAVSIEGREPLIDHRLVEFAVSLPFHLRRGALGPKHLLRKILYRYVPRQLVDRPKQGFAVPLQRWLAKDLAYLLDEYLADADIARQGVLDRESVRRLVARFKNGDASVGPRVWLLLAFQMWHARWMH